MHGVSGAPFNNLRSLCTRSSSISCFILSSSGKMIKISCRVSPYRNADVRPVCKQCICFDAACEINFFTVSLSTTRAKLLSLYQSMSPFVIKSQGKMNFSFVAFFPSGKVKGYDKILLGWIKSISVWSESSHNFAFGVWFACSIEFGTLPD